ncbi:ABC transporter permease [bacterium]|nr:ABC transporter permease [bacterium]MBT5015814.1 ABC transporter permease [bacterium]
MKQLILMLGWRILKGARHEQSISTMIKISFLGIAIGVFSMALVVSIMNGFEKVTHEKMQNIHPQLFIRSDGYPMNAYKLGSMFKKEFPEIAAYAPSDTQNVLLENNTTHAIDTVLVLRGIDPEREANVSALHTKLTQTLDNSKSFPKLLIDNQILIGKKLAQNLELDVGQTITLFYAHQKGKQKRSVSFDEVEVVVSGIFDTGIDEFDSNLVISSLEFLKEIFPKANPTEIGLRLDPNASEDKLIHDLNFRIGLDVLSWKQLYPALVSALQLEKYVMFFLLALITLVASMNIISLTFMQIIRKQKDMALLQALGLAPQQVAYIFYIVGFLLTSIASIVGLACAFFVGIFLDRYPFIELPDVYYVTKLPIRMSPLIFGSMFLLALFFTAIALWIPIRTLKKMKIANVLRFEA